MIDLSKFLKRSFDEKTAEEFLAAIFDEKATEIAIESLPELTGPDGFSYVGLVINPDPAKNTDKCNLEELVDILLIDGLGLVLFSGADMAKPKWTYSYANMLCFSIFGRLSPHDSLNQDKYPNAVVNPPVGTEVIATKPSEEVFPDYAQAVLEQQISKAVGRTVRLNPQLLQYPKLDKLIRFKLNIPGADKLKPDVQKKVGNAVTWCLPYFVVL